MAVTQLKNWLASRSRKKEITTIVLHATGGESAIGAIDWLRKIGLSYHYVIPKKGIPIKCVPTSRVAFHAGVSNGPEGSNVNEYSIGISLANRNDGVDGYTDSQYHEVDQLVAELKRAYPSIKWITCHYSISPGRKSDPRKFEVSRVANGLQMWGCK